MTDIYIGVISVVSVLTLPLLFYYIAIPKMNKEMSEFSWDQYFNQCGIYQGTSHWTTIKSILLKMKR